jgi:hypothetical protein
MNTVVLTDGWSVAPKRGSNGTECGDLHGGGQHQSLTKCRRARPILEYRVSVQSVVEGDRLVKGAPNKRRHYRRD